MQNRIEELIAECSYTTTTYENGIYESFRDFDKEKFAELIIKECCNIFVELHMRPVGLVVKDVKEHFGIKE